MVKKFKLKYLLNPDKWSDPAAFIIFWICFLFTVVILPLIILMI